MNLLVFVKVCHESKECMVIQSFNIICLILLEYITHVNVQQDLQHAAEDAIEASAGHWKEKYAFIDYTWELTEHPQLLTEGREEVFNLQ